MLDRDWTCVYCEKEIGEEEHQTYHSVPECGDDAKAHGACCERFGYCAVYFGNNR